MTSATPLRNNKGARLVASQRRTPFKIQKGALKIRWGNPASQYGIGSNLNRSKRKKSTIFDGGKFPRILVTMPTVWPIIHPLIWICLSLCFFGGGWCGEPLEAKISGDQEISEVHF